MRHNKAGRSLGRNTPHRMAMMRNMVTSLIDHERITTTDARAKELRKLADRMITLGKRGDLHARRQVLAIIRDRKVVSKLFDRLAPRYQDRPGGYTRIIKLGSRLGDNAAMSIIELVEESFTPKTRKKSPKPAKPVKAVAPSAAADEPVKGGEETAADQTVVETAEADANAAQETAAPEEVAGEEAEPEAAPSGDAEEATKQD